MTYEEAEKYLQNNIELIRYHNSHLADKTYLFRIKWAIIAGINASSKEISDVAMLMTDSRSNTQALMELSLITDDYDVFLFLELPQASATIMKLSDYLIKEEEREARKRK